MSTISFHAPSAPITSQCSSMRFIYTRMSTVYSFSLKHFYSGYLVLHFPLSSQPFTPPPSFLSPKHFQSVLCISISAYINVFEHAHRCAVLCKHLSGLNPNKRQFVSPMCFSNAYLVLVLVFHEVGMRKERG